jgi:hypothetical protein
MSPNSFSYIRYPFGCSVVMRADEELLKFGEVMLLARPRWSDGGAAGRRQTGAEATCCSSFSYV